MCAFQMHFSCFLTSGYSFLLSAVIVLSRLLWSKDKLGTTREIRLVSRALQLFFPASFPVV